MLGVLQFLKQFQLFEAEIVDHKLVGLGTSVVVAESCLEFCTDLLTGQFQGMLYDGRERLIADVTIELELLGCLGDFATQDNGLSGWFIGDQSVDLGPQLGRDALKGGCGGYHRRHSVQFWVLYYWC